MNPKDNGSSHDEVVYEAEPGFKTVFHIVFWSAMVYLAFVFI